MDQERLWAPWRLGYIKGGEQPPPPPEPSAWLPGADRDCFLCRAAADHSDPDADRKLLVLARTDLVVVVLNRYPYSNGHLLVSPRRHLAQLIDLDDDTLLATSQMLRTMTERLTERLGAQGCNVGLNMGQVAGAGVPGHLHWHVVPRWPGDHNFMPVTAGARVLPQSLEEAWETLRIE